MAQRLAIVIAVLYLIAGCQLLPVVEHQPTFHNPFPQLSRVGVAPFINASTEERSNGRNVALAYYNELQAIPGFEVTPVGIIELKAQDMGLRLSNPDEIRAVARELKPDAIIVWRHYGLHTILSAAYVTACRLVRGESRLSSDPDGLRITMGHSGRRRDSTNTGRSDRI